MTAAAGGWRMVARTHGGPEVIEREAFDPGAPGPGELLIETEAIGLNFIDVYFRAGVYPAPAPFTLSAESVGRVIAVGPEVTGFSAGDRVGSVFGLGAYATHRVIAAERAIPIPDDVSSQDAAVLLLKGMTTCYLAEDTTQPGSGDTVLVLAAAGGVGSLLVPWLRDKGVKVIAHTGSAEKAAHISADHALSCPFADLSTSVRELTSGDGVSVAYDSVGKDSWSASLGCLARRGLMVSFGNASGVVPPVSLLELSQRGSLYVTRPTLADYVATPEALRHTAARVFDRLRRGVIAPVIGQHFALADAAAAHRALEARTTVGATVLLP